MRHVSVHCNSIFETPSTKSYCPPPLQGRGLSMLFWKEKRKERERRGMGGGGYGRPSHKSSRNKTRNSALGDATTKGKRDVGWEKGRGCGMRWKRDAMEKGCDGKGMRWKRDAMEKG